MRKPSTRKITTAPADKAAKTIVAKAATAARATIATPAVTVPAIVAPAVAVPAVAKPSANITRTAATVAAQRTNFGSLSDRDTAYLGFYRRLANGGALTVTAINASGMRPPYVGSNKPHDAGVIVRLIKAGLLAPVGTDGHGFTVTALGTSTKA